jgi:serine/threonine-protein kinase
MVAEDIANAATAVTAPGAPATMIAERYEVLGLLGAGGMGRVYRARDSQLDEVVALKMLRKELAELPGMLERFRQEVKLARRVTHANVVRTFDLGQHGDDHFLTMEYIEGRSLAQLLGDGPPPFEEALRILRAVTAGIAAAHASKVLHRDLKPDNVLVGKAGRIAVTDFGIARLAQTPASTGDRFIGTPAYMAPEQVEGAEVTAASDVYSIGAIMFETLTGRRPWLGDDPFAVALARLREPPPDPRSVRAVPDALANLVVRCLAREPEGRFRDAAALGEALATIGDVDSTVQKVFVPAVPEKHARAVAILPLRATGELAEVADGLSEEIVDALTMTKALRVRPLTSMRAVAKRDLDARELGLQLGVDVIVEGTIRQRGSQIRIAARAVGVADGFQLWASHFDCGPDGLLAAGDQVVQALARALVVEVQVPARRAVDAHIAESYLEGKARLRAAWLNGHIGPALAVLEPLLSEASDDPRIVATTAMAFARSAFYGVAPHLERARVLADHAIALSPDLGEAQLVRAFIHLYSGELPAAAATLLRTVRRVPGFALAQGSLGALLLEAGNLEEAVVHLEAAFAIDPTAAHIGDLARAYVYSGRAEEGIRLLTGTGDPLAEIAIARFHMWRGEAYTMAEGLPRMSGDLATYFDAVVDLMRTRSLDQTMIDMLFAAVAGQNIRLRAARAQYLTEWLMFAGRQDIAMRAVDIGVEAGLTDIMWMERCPLLAGLRTLPGFRANVALVAERARGVIEAVFDA